jgi:hypothetical protein
MIILSGVADFPLSHPVLSLPPPTASGPPAASTDGEHYDLSRVVPCRLNRGTVHRLELLLLCHTGGDTHPPELPASPVAAVSSVQSGPPAASTDGEHSDLFLVVSIEELYTGLNCCFCVTQVEARTHQNYLYHLYNLARLLHQLMVSIPTCSLSFQLRNCTQA